MTFLKNLGEPKVIHLLQAYIDSTDLGSNEDAYLCSNTLPYLLVNVDTMSRDSDFLPQQTWKQIGEKLVAITFSDLAAKGAEPQQFLSSLVLEDTMKEDELVDLASAIHEASNKYGAKYLGGDLGSSSEAVLTGIGLGSITNGNILARKGSHKGDLVCVTGAFGLTPIGFDYLLSPTARKFDRIPDKILKQAIKVLYEPHPRLLEGKLLSEHNLATASIDSSDGLAISLHWLAEASNIGIKITNLPLHPELTPYIDSQQIIQEITMFGGEEYELVFTVHPSKLSELKQLFERYNCHIFVIGECTSSKGVVFMKNKTITPIPMRGWDAFQKHPLR